MNNSTTSENVNCKHCGDEIVSAESCPECGKLPWEIKECMDCHTEKAHKMFCVQTVLIGGKNETISVISKDYCTLEQPSACCLV